MALDRSAVAYAVYNAGLAVAGVLALPALPWLTRSRARIGLGQRFGALAPEVAAQAGRAPIWVHAASVGEVLAAQPLVELLRRQETAHPVVMTTTSLSGLRTARAQLGVPATLLPVDLPWVVRRAMRCLKPAVLVILETELWPNLFRAAGREGVPLLLVSGRLSPGAAEWYGWIRPLMRAALQHVCAVAAQSQADAERFAALGLPRERLQVVGSLKFARQIPAETQRDLPLRLGERPVLVAASTQAGEEAIVLDACERVWRSHPGALLVVAPRRPERFAEVAALLAEKGVQWVRRTAAGDEVPAAAQVLLLDTLGELLPFFAVARGAFVGGTLVPLGGHNLLEPAMFGVPVWFGPSVDNVRDAAEMLVGVSGGAQIGTADELAAAWTHVLDYPAAARAMGARARTELERRAATAVQTLALVQAHLRRRPGRELPGAPGVEL